jgi:hypothetical protein
MRHITMGCELGFEKLDDFSNRLFQAIRLYEPFNGGDLDGTERASCCYTAQWHCGSW